MGYPHRAQSIFSSQLTTSKLIASIYINFNHIPVQRHRGITRTFNQLPVDNNDSPIHSGMWKTPTDSIDNSREKNSSRSMRYISKRGKKCNVLCLRRLTSLETRRFQKYINDEQQANLEKKIIKLLSSQFPFPKKQLLLFLPFSSTLIINTLPALHEAPYVPRILIVHRFHESLVILPSIARKTTFKSLSRVQILINTAAAPKPRSCSGRAYRWTGPNYA